MHVSKFSTGHRVTVEVIERATEGATATDLYMRGPTEGVPVAIVLSTPAPATTAAPKVSP